MHTTYFNITERTSTHIQCLKHSFHALIVDFDSSWIDIYIKHIVNMIRVRTLQYSEEDCVLALLAIFVIFPSSFLVNAATTKAVNVDE